MSRSQKSNEARDPGPRMVFGIAVANLVGLAIVLAVFLVRFGSQVVEYDTGDVLIAILRVALVGTVAGLVLTVLSLYLLPAALRDMRLRAPAVGTISKVDVFAGMSNNNPVYRVTLDYRYQVGNQKHKGQARLALFSKILYRLRLKKYDRGKHISVFYDPAKPDESSLRGSFPRYRNLVLATLATHLGGFALSAVILSLLSGFLLWVIA